MEANDTITATGCPRPPLTLEYLGLPVLLPYINDMYFHKFASKFCLAAVGFTCLVCGFLIWRHARHYSRPCEQRHIMRMIGIIPVFSILSWGATEILYTKGQMILIVEDLYESFAFASFFLLVVAWVERSRDEKLVSYKTRQSPSPSRGSEDSTASDEVPAIPRMYYPLIFQFPVMMTIMTIVVIATTETGVYCVDSNEVHFAHLWVTIFKAISTVVAFGSLIRFARSMKPHIIQHHPRRKLIAFKSIIGIRFIQNIIMNALLTHDVLEPTKTLTWQDYQISIPSMVLCAEMVIYSCIFLWAFRVKDYKMENIPAEEGNGVTEYQGGRFGLLGFVDAANTLDLLKLCVKSFIP